MGKKFIIGIGAFLLLAGALAFYKYSQISALMAKGYVPPPEAITTISSKTETWNDTIVTTGSFIPVQGTMIKAEEPGKIVSINFESGKPVQEGQLLVQIDTSVEEANLKAALAKADLSASTLSRIMKLKGTGALSERDIDDAQYQFKQNSADVDNILALIDKKTIKAPFTGFVGIRQVNIGQYVAPGDPIVPLQTLSPIYIEFQLPQQDLAKVKVEQKIEIRVDTFSDKVFTGIINAINPEVDDRSRSVKIQATIENADGLLRPGMYGNVIISLGNSHKYLTIPGTAINRAPYGNSVYVVEDMHDEKTGKNYLGVRQEFVQVGPSRGDQVAILSGLKEGEEVATSGLFKLRPKAEVLIDNTATPENNPAPQPPDT
jgi:membrane fusion protein (multidrug efflux system)